MRTPIELINLYWEEVWNRGNVELIREICADPLIRHDPMSTTKLTHQDQIDRVVHARVREPIFTHEVLLANDRHVCSVWNMTIRKGERELSGIEVFQVDEGRLSHAWNSPYTPGLWGREGDESVAIDLSPPEVLATHDAVTAAWLQSMFQHGGQHVPRIGDIFAVEPVGHGTLSETARIRFVYNAAPGDNPEAVICKFSRPSPAIEAANKRLRFYEREIESYRFLAAAPGLPVPKIYFAKMSDDGIVSNIVMEDLSERAEAGDQIAGCSLAEADAAVRALGDLHARFAGAEVPEWVLARAERAEDMAASYRVGAQAIKTLLGDSLSDAEIEIIDTFADLYVQWARLPALTRTFLHGDARVDNMLFEANEGEAPRALLVDWQLSDFGSPAFDLAYFLTGSIEPDVRRANEERWIAEHAAAVALSDPRYTADVARQAYGLQTLSGLAATVVAARTVPPSDHSRLLLSTLARRNCAAIGDWKPLEQLQQLTANGLA